MRRKRSLRRLVLGEEEGLLVEAAVDVVEAAAGVLVLALSNSPYVFS